MAPDPDQILYGLRCLAETLDLELVNLRAPERGSGQQSLDMRSIPRAAIVTKLAYVTGPLAVGIVPLDPVYELVCACHMSKRMFQDYVEEKLSLDDQTWEHHGTRLTLEGHRLRHFGADALSDAKIILSYHQYDESFFDGQIVRFPEALIRSGLRAQQQALSLRIISEAYDSQEFNRGIMGKFVAVTTTNPEEDIDITNSAPHQTFSDAYLAIRQWAVDCGLLSPVFHMITEKIILSLLARGFHELDVTSEDDWVARILKTEPFAHVIHHGLIVNAPSGLCLTADLPPGVDGAFSRIAQETRRGNHALEGSEGFLGESDHFLKIHGLCWGPQKVKARLEDRMAEAMLSLNVGSRIWPLSLSDPSKGEATYLMGLNPERDCENPSTVPDLARVEEAFRVLEYDQTVMSLHHEVLTREEAESLLREAADSRGDRDDESRTDGPRTAMHEPEKHRFRTAAAVMDRLRWDEHLNAEEFEVGYVDRFEAELMWKDLDRWERHTEEEEFVPEHRVRRIRRVRDGAVVWDREKRLDRT